MSITGDGPWFVAFDPLPMGAPGAAENGGVWLGAEATGPPKPPVVAPRLVDRKEVAR